MIRNLKRFLYSIKVGVNLKRLKPIHYLFIIANTLGVFLEYFLIYKVLLVNILNLSTHISIIITLVILIVFFILAIYTLINSQNVFEPNKVHVIKAFHEETINHIKKAYRAKTEKDISINFVDGKLQPSIMFALVDNIYINTNKLYSYQSIDDIHFEGILAHEVGHAMHMSKIYALANLRISAVIGNILFIDTINYSYKLNKKKKKLLTHILFIFRYTLFILFNLLNIFILYPFKKYEELAADRLSLTVSNGYSLRGYYFKIMRNHQSKLEKFRFKFIDLNHPCPKTHYDKLNNLMKDTNKNCELYKSNQVYVYKYSNELDRYSQIIHFVENDVLSKLPSIYMYLARLSEKNNDLDYAKKYYLLAGQSNQLIGYRKLIRILKHENNLTNVMEYYKILAKHKDKEALIVTNYYHQEFYLEKVTHNNQVIPSSNESIVLSLNNEIIHKKNQESTLIKFNRSNQTIYLSNSLIYILKNNMIISRPYIIHKEENNEVVEVIEYYHKKQ